MVGRYQYSRQRFDNEDVILGEATQQNNRQANFGLTWTHTFSSRTVGELRYGLGVRDTNVNIKINEAPNTLPIGHYLLFAIDSAGVPSVAKILKKIAKTPPRLAGRSSRREGRGAGGGEEPAGLPRLDVSSREVADAYMLATGGLAPLTGFIGART